MIVADTNILVDALRGREPGASRVRAGVEGGNLATTAISVYELESFRGRRAGVDELLGALRVYELDTAAARVAGELRRELDASGQGIEDADCLIAGICIARGIELLTRDGHFARVPSLRLA